MFEKDKLIRIIDEGEELQKKDITNSDPDFKAWKLKAERFLISQFGEKSHEYEEFQKINFGVFIYTFKETHNDWVNACQKGIREALAFLRIYIEEVPDSTQPVHSSESIKPFKLMGYLLSLWVSLNAS